ncbi:MAG: autotransporter [Pseudomonas sp.]|nr:autotransporter [Pseudomonas sp.]
MHTSRHRSQLLPGRLTILAIAIASAVAAGLPINAQAQVISGAETTTQYWTSGDFSVTPTGQINATSAAIRTSGSVGMLSNSGMINSTGFGIVNDNGSIVSVDNALGGTIYAGSIGIINSSSIGALSNSGSIIANQGVMNFGAIDTMTNNGLIHATILGFLNDGSLTSLDNNNGATIEGAYGIFNNGSIGTLNNSGTISGTTEGILNQGTITSFNNNLGGTISSINTAVVNYAATIGTLNNSGTINGAFVGILNQGTITSLNNTLDGTISSASVAVVNAQTFAIGTLTNSGIIKGDVAGIYNEGTIGTLNNSGTISSAGYAIYNTSTGTISTLDNSGTLAGTIVNESTNDLVINSTGSIGLLTGFDPNGSQQTAIGQIGQITNTHSNLIFGSGFQFLNDHVDVGNFTVSNTAAILAVANPINITGNYTQGASSSLLLAVFDNAVTTGQSTDSGYGRLTVSGSANVASGSSIGLLSAGNYGFAQGQRYLVIQAATAGTHYNASSLNYSATGYSVPGATVVGTSVVDGNNTNLLVTLGTTPIVIPPVVIPPVITPPVIPPVNNPPVVTPPVDTRPINRATTTGGITTLNGLFNYSGFDAGVMNLFNAAAALDSSTSGNHAGAQLSPTANLAAAAQASTASTLQVLNVTTAHIDGLRSAQNGNNGSGIATGESASNSGLWGQAFGGSARMDERDDISGYHARYSGMLLGADAMLNDSWRAGGLFSYTRTTLNNDGDNNGSSADVNSYGLFGYASYTGSPWYVDLSAGAVQHQYDTRREVDFTGFNGIAKGQHDGMQYVAAVQAGYPIDLGSSMAHAILTPIVGLTYSTLRQDSYTEKGGNGAALHVDADNLGSLKSDLGAKLERSFATAYGALVPSAQLTWRHEYRDTGLQSVANYAADTAGATSFSTTGAKLADDTGVLALGITLMRGRNVSLSAKYTLEAASAYTANTGDVQVRWEF